MGSSWVIIICLISGSNRQGNQYAAMRYPRDIHQTAHSVAEEFHYSTFLHLDRGYVVLKLRPTVTGTEFDLRLHSMVWRGISDSIVVHNVHKHCEDLCSIGAS